MLPPVIIPIDTSGYQRTGEAIASMYIAMGLFTLILAGAVVGISHHIFSQDIGHLIYVLFPAAALFLALFLYMSFCCLTLIQSMSVAFFYGVILATVVVPIATEKGLLGTSSAGVKGGYAVVIIGFMMIMGVLVKIKYVAPALNIILALCLLPIYLFAFVAGCLLMIVELDWPIETVVNFVESIADIARPIIEQWWERI